MGSIPVGVGNDPALPADEEGLVDPVLLLDVMALGAFLAGVRRIDVHQRDACPARLVLNELPELVEGPGVERDPLGLAEPYPLPDSAQVFQGDAGRGAFSLGHDLFRDDVVDVRGVPRFLAAPVLEPSPGGLGALGLQLLPQVELPLTVPVQAAVEAARYPVDVVAMLAMPRSTPMNWSGSYCSASGTSHTAIR